MYAAIWILLLVVSFVLPTYGKGSKELNEALVAASMNGNLKEVQALLAKGADANAKDSHQDTALAVAVSYDHLEIVKELLAKGADANDVDRNRETVLTTASRVGHLELDKGADINARGSNFTALIGASMDDHPEVVRELLARGANVNLRSALGDTALMLASQRGDTEIVQLLKAAGAK